ncbi:MAG TPA: hypothetical protein VK988_07590, partial [Acidimicrobiales bacterium]|nr:hypothetical protein [Acidimicrobiales bacterium]
MERSLVADLPVTVGRAARVCGWLQQPHAGPGSPSLVVRDATGAVPLVWVGDGTAPGAPIQSAVEVVGTVRRGPAPVGSYELVVDELRVVGPALAEVPLGPSSSLDDRLDWRFLDLRSP